MPKFTTTRPLTMYKEGDFPSKNSRFLSGITSKHLVMGGVVAYAWLMTGILPDEVDDSSGDVGDDASAGLAIQDPVLMENRNRTYSDDCYKLWTAYTVSANALDFARYGIMLSNDVLQCEFHKEDMERQCGRRLIPGDVIEMRHLRDVGISGVPMNRWYVVQSITKSPRGFDLAWDYHILAVTLKPLKNSQEFSDLMDRPTYEGVPGADGGTDLGSVGSTEGSDNVNTAAIQDEAFKYAYTTWWDITRVYIDIDTAKPYRWTDDGEPPNGLPVQQLDHFPTDALDGDYVVRIDMYPNRLYRFEQQRWIFKELDIKREWNTYNWVRKLRDFETDRSVADDLRPWQYVSIHDVQGPNEAESKPSRKAGEN